MTMYGAAAKKEAVEKAENAVTLAILLLGKGASDADIAEMANGFLKMDSATLAEMSSKARARRQGKQCRKK